MKQLPHELAVAQDFIKVLAEKLKENGQLSTESTSVLLTIRDAIKAIKMANYSHPIDLSVIQELYSQSELVTEANTESIEKLNEIAKNIKEKYDAMYEARTAVTRNLDGLKTNLISYENTAEELYKNITATPTKTNPLKGKILLIKESIYEKEQADKVRIEAENKLKQDKQRKLLEAKSLIDTHFNRILNSVVSIDFVALYNESLVNGGIDLWISQNPSSKASIEFATNQNRSIKDILAIKPKFVIDFLQKTLFELISKNVYFIFSGKYEDPINITKVLQPLGVIIEGDDTHNNELINHFSNLVQNKKFEYQNIDNFISLILNDILPKIKIFENFEKTLKELQNNKEQAEKLRLENEALAAEKLRLEEEKSKAKQLAIEQELQAQKLQDQAQLFTSQTIEVKRKFKLEVPEFNAENIRENREFIFKVLSSFCEILSIQNSKLPRRKNWKDINIGDMIQAIEDLKNTEGTEFNFSNLLDNKFSFKHEIVK